MPCPYENLGRGDFFATCHHSAAPAITETTLAACAFVNPRNDRGLMRMNSTRNRATPVRIRYAANTSPAGRAADPVCLAICSDFPGDDLRADGFPSVDLSASPASIR